MAKGDPSGRIAAVHFDGDRKPAFQAGEFDLAQDNFDKGLYIVSEKHIARFQGDSRFTFSNVEKKDADSTLTDRALRNAGARAAPEKHLLVEKHYVVVKAALPGSLTRSLKNLWDLLECEPGLRGLSSERADSWYQHGDRPPVIIVLEKDESFGLLLKGARGDQSSDDGGPWEPDPAALKLCTLHYWGSSLKVQQLRSRLCRAAHSPYASPVGAGNHGGSVQPKSRIARWFPPVLIMGPPGSGKQVAAHCIHRLTHPKSPGTICVINCEDSEDNLERQIFGTNPGGQRIPGALESYSTVVLDRVLLLPKSLQYKLDAALRRAEPKRGISAKLTGTDGKDQEVSARLIALSGSDVGDALRQDRFLASLYYRLSTLVVETPSLNEQPGDIDALASGFWTRATGDPNAKVSDEVLLELRGRRWPGNARELGYLVQSCVHQAPGKALLELPELHQALEDRYHRSNRVLSGSEREAASLRKLRDLLQRIAIDIERSTQGEEEQLLALESLESRAAELHGLATSPIAFATDPARDLTYSSYFTTQEYLELVGENLDAPTKRRAQFLNTLKECSQKVGSLLLAGSRAAH